MPTCSPMPIDHSPSPADPPFVPARWLAGGHRQTIVSALPRRVHGLHSEIVELQVDADTRIRMRCNWQEDTSAITLVLVHGLTGDSDAPYVRATARKALERGLSVIRVDVRSCGDTESWSATTYQAGLTQDLRAVLDWVTHERGRKPPTIAGWSLGGNMALKLAGELGLAAHSTLRSIVAICPAIELAGCADLADAPGFARVYRRFFLKDLRRKLRRKHALAGPRFATTGAKKSRTMRAFDERFTAQHWHYRDVHEYYDRASALPWIPSIKVPCTIFYAVDDPLVPCASFERDEVRHNPNVRVIANAHGGHCSFYGRKNRVDPDRWWVENRVVDLACNPPSPS